MRKTGLLMGAAAAGMLVFGPASTGPSFAQTENTGQSCAAIEDGGARLLCYDAVFRVTHSNDAPAGLGIWKSDADTSKIDDSKEVYLSVDSAEPVSTKFGEGDPATLTVRCQKRTTAVSIYFGGAFMADSGGFGKVVYRIDKKPAVTKAWDVSTSNKHLGLWNGGTAIPFIKSLFGANQVLIEATPFNEDSVTLTFPVAGLESAIKPLRDACKW